MFYEPGVFILCRPLARSDRGEDTRSSKLLKSVMVQPLQLDEQEQEDGAQASLWASLVRDKK